METIKDLCDIVSLHDNRPSKSSPAYNRLEKLQMPANSPNEQVLIMNKIKKLLVSANSQCLVAPQCESSKKQDR